MQQNIQIRFFCPHLKIAATVNVKFGIPGPVMGNLVPPPPPLGLVYQSMYEEQGEKINHATLLYLQGQRNCTDVNASLT